MRFSIVEQINKCSFPSALHIHNHTFAKWWRNLLVRLSWKRFLISAVDNINANHILLTDMIENQEIRGTFIRNPRFYKWRKDKHLSELIPHLQVSLYAGVHFVQILGSLSCSLIMFFRVSSPVKILIETASDACKKDYINTTFKRKIEGIFSLKLRRGSVQKSDAVIA